MGGQCLHNPVVKFFNLAAVCECIESLCRPFALNYKVIPLLRVLGFWHILWHPFFGFNVWGYAICYYLQDGSGVL